jgi:NAD(P)-dependent dehydrogenase (short-subunit alcohol dehydrogenase family)
MSLVSMFKGKGPSGFGYGSTADEVTAGVDLSGKSVLVTGVSSGLGRETARVLARRGARVLGAARTADKARAALEGTADGAVPLACELSEPASVRACVEEAQRLGGEISCIVCNAGVMALPKLEQAHGYELQFFTNHVGHFLLVTGLLPRLAAHARVVVVSSSAHQSAPPEGIQLDNLSGERGYSPWLAYGQSKLANILFAKELARRLPAGQTANAVHPGVIATNLVRNMNGVLRAVWAVASPIGMKNVAQGAATQCYVAGHPAVASVSGEYFVDCNVAQPSHLARDAALARRLWDESERIVARL